MLPLRLMRVSCGASKRAYVYLGRVLIDRSTCAPLCSVSDWSSTFLMLCRAPLRIRQVASRAALASRTAPHSSHSRSFTALRPLASQESGSSSTASTHSAASVPPGSSTSDAPIASKIVRDPRYSTLTAADVEHFRSVVGEEGVVQEKERLKGFNTDWMRKFRQ